MRRQWVVFLCILSAFPILPLRGQTDPRLVEAIRDAQQGNSDSARIKVRRLLTTTEPSDTLYPQIVYTQAMVASDAADMRRQLQRVAVEYSASSWADDALLRLVQLDYASANLNGAARNLERIRLDYPGSPLIPQAAYWGARTYFDQKKPEVACRWISDGLTGASANIELQNQLRYLNQRCTQFAVSPEPQRRDTQAGTTPAADSQRVLAAVPRDSTRPTGGPIDTIRLSAPPSTVSRTPPSQPETAPPTQPAVRTRYRIQITAVRSQATAQSMMAKLKSRGFTPIAVEEGGLYKVRVGDYATKAEAVAAVSEVKAKLGGSPFVVAGS